MCEMLPFKKQIFKQTSHYIYAELYKLKTIKELIHVSQTQILAFAFSPVFCGAGQGSNPEPNRKELGEGCSRELHAQPSHHLVICLHLQEGGAE